MVVLLDLDLDFDGDSDEDHSNSQLNIALNQQLSGVQQLRIHDSVARHTNDADGHMSIVSHRPQLEITRYAALLASALACYPIALSIASYLDLNDLFSLSLSCHQVHNRLGQFAHNLRAESLRCVNDDFDGSMGPSSEGKPDTDALLRAVEEQGYDMDMVGLLPVSSPAVQTTSARFHGGRSSGLGLSGRISKCARDLVASCRRCGIVICRNCANKPPSAKLYAGRHRRLCQACLDAPIHDHLQGFSESWEHQEAHPASSTSSLRSVRSLSTGSAPSHTSTEEKQAFTSPVFLRMPCECDSHGVYLCQPCGQNLAAANTTYKRVWTWRSRYSTHIGGGLGTGLGQGEQGQKCGRGDYCLEKSAAGVCWVEIDCSDAHGHDRFLSDFSGGNRSPAPIHPEVDSAQTRSRPGYFTQEIEGIGGVVKKKVKKRVKVGATVYEYEDERETGNYLERESSGEIRSWCGWCFRVCPGLPDKPIVNSLLLRKT